MTREKTDFGLVQIYFGEGKGKTTAALGQAIRAHGNGKNIAFIYFDKGGDDYNERRVLESCGLTYYAFGRNRRRSNGTFDFSITDEDRQMATDAMHTLREIDEQYDLIVLDEVLNAIRLEMLPLAELMNYLNTEKPEKLEIICTGQGLPDELKERADLITEMKLHKHYMYDGVPAREGIEW